jgi:hypothetical protein
MFTPSEMSIIQGQLQSSLSSIASSVLSGFTSGPAGTPVDVVPPPVAPSFELPDWPEMPSWPSPANPGGTSDCCVPAHLMQALNTLAAVMGSGGGLMYGVRYDAGSMTLYGDYLTLSDGVVSVDSRVIFTATVECD